MAKRLNLFLAIRAIDRATGPLRKVNRAVRTVGRATGIGRLAREAVRVSRQIGRVGNEVNRLGRRVALLGGAAGAGVFGLTSRFAAAGDNIAKTADKLGLGVVELQRWRFAATQGGVSIQTFDMAMQRFGRRAAEAARRSRRSAIWVSGSGTPRATSAR